MKLKRNAATPLHQQIQALLRQKIVSNQLRADEAIPSERDLSEDLSVSRMTVRQALNALREEGLIYQKRGKGTFVSPLKMDIHTRNLKGFSDEMVRRGMTPTSRIIGSRAETAGQEQAEKLHLAIGAPVFTLKRLRLADNIPMSVETTCLPSAQFGGLEKYDFSNRSLYQILETDYGVKIYSAAEDLEAAAGDSETSEYLAVAVGSPLLIVSRTVFAEGNQPIEYTKSVYRADRYRASFYLVKK
jgi:GntR family transcriptional regulator